MERDRVVMTIIFLKYYGLSFSVFRRELLEMR